VLLCIAHDPGVRLRDIAASLGITERSAHGIITDLTTAGYSETRRLMRAVQSRTAGCDQPPGAARADC
jgi:DNA-binding MarR family transcriptional regulator